MASFLVRVALVFLGWSVAHLAVAAALTVGLVPGGWWTIAAAYALFVVGPLAVLLRTFREDAYPSKATRLFVMRPFWYVMLGLPLLSVPGALAWLAGLPFGAGLAWGRAAVLVGGAFAVVLFLAGYIGSKSLAVRKLDIAFHDLPADLDGVVIAQLSDVHVGPHTSERFLRRIAKAVKDARPHLIVHTGDQVDDHDRDVARYGRIFGDLTAPLGHYAIAGNHDVYAGWPGVKQGLEAAGMRVLVNEAVPVKHGGSELWVVGTGDPAGAQSFGGVRPSEVAPDIPRAMAGVPPGAFSLVLAHNPALWPALVEHGARLTLSGHTHHGQISIPPLKWSLASPFLELAMGEYARGASRLYIHPGTNHWGLPFRLGAWPEVALLTLKRA